MAGKSMIGLVISLLIGCGVLGYLLYKIWMVRKGRRMNGDDVMGNRNASARRKRSKRRRTSRSRKRRKSRRRRRRTRTGKRSRSRKRKKSSSKKPKSADKDVPAVTINPVPQIIEPVQTKIDEKQPTLDEKQPNQGYTVIGRRRLKPQETEIKTSANHCMNYKDLYSSLFQAANHIDSIENLLPCNKNDASKLSKYEYELNYDEEHLFRC